MANLFALSLLLLTFSLPFLIFATEYTAPSSAVEMLRGTADPKFKRAIEPIMFQFPKDHGAHPEYKTEWWYYTGNLEDTSGLRFGYQLTFFRVALSDADRFKNPSRWKISQIYFAHMTVTDIESGHFFFFERINRTAMNNAGAQSEPLKIIIPDG